MAGQPCVAAPLALNRSFYENEIEEIIMKNLLLLSNPTVAPGGFLEYARPWIAELFHSSPQSPKTLLFVPYAVKNCEGRAKVAAEALEPLHIKIISAHASRKPVELLDKVDGVFVGGGNTFRLLQALQETGLLTAIKAKAEAGMPFMGASAGTNVATPTIKTTNDMPIIPLASLDAMGLVPFQINPHYVDGVFFYMEDGKIVPYNGETRIKRIAEFHEENKTPVVGLREGTAIRVKGMQLELLGGKQARLFKQGEAPTEIDGHGLSKLMASLM
jgi:dipeptidase E